MHSLNTGEMVQGLSSRFHCSANPGLILTCIFRPAALPAAGRPITVVPLKRRADKRAGHSRTRAQRPAGPCEAASSSESGIAAPSADRGP